MKQRITLSKLAIVLGASALLSACGAGKVVNTQDNSAEYKTAKSLPPLKKPTPVVVTQRAPVGVVEQQAETAVEPVADVSAAVEAAQSEATLNDAPEVAVENIDDAVETIEVAQSEQAVVSAAAVSSANIVDDGSGQARLKIDAGFEQAWVYLSDNLKKSDLTVFSRNKAAGRFSIGCANIAAAPTVTKNGRWSFFNRDRQPRLEYCALQAVERRGATLVSVLNRSGEEVTAEYSRDVFTRLLSE